MILCGDMVCGPKYQNVGLMENVSDLSKKCKRGIKYNVQIACISVCNICVRQGEDLSPFLISLFIYDIESFSLSNEIVGFNCPYQNTTR